MEKHSEPTQQELDRRLMLMTRRAHGLTTLMTRRTELRTVFPRADYIAESVVWGV
jgi:hypothetical protein